MYTLLRARQSGKKRYDWTGHIYDISISGMRFELDSPLPHGQRIEIRGMLPGEHHTTFCATGHVVRLHGAEDNDPGPARMAMSFETFESQIDRRRLAEYLQRTADTLADRVAA
ncbi:PilZ domain protein [Mucisphaera calidilacus]|uniref:PilZ domain protein n=2 Tax=Mucisphaera calidilacus TaxID=2527982 RepID=A0A518BYR0_9BACT|nr:PilZ domain protein [Mucisphaera calidilacus]